MNETQFFNAMCEAMLDDTWQGLIQDEIDANPETLDFCTPECVGRLDGEEHLDCDPGRHGYRTILESEAYVIGWKAATEVQDLLDAREDEEFIRHGGN